MRTTISIPDGIYAAAKEVLEARSFSELAAEAIRNVVLNALHRHRDATGELHGHNDRTFGGQ